MQILMIDDVVMHSCYDTMACRIEWLCEQCIISWFSPQRFLLVSLTQEHLIHCYSLLLTAWVSLLYLTVVRSEEQGSRKEGGKRKREGERKEMRPEWRREEWWRSRKGGGNSDEQEAGVRKKRRRFKLYW